MSSGPGERADTATDDEPRRDPTPAELAAQQGVPARGASHYAKGTAANMARSMLVIVGITLALFFIAGQESSTPPQSIDVAEVAEDRGAQADQGFSYAADLPEEWAATSARYAQSEGDVMMWNAGYTTPDDEYVSVRQAVDPSREWIDSQTSQGARAGSLETEDGRTWVKRDSDDNTRRSLVDDPSGSGQLTTLVTGTGSWSQLEEFADHLVEAEPADTGSSGGGPSTQPSGASD